MNSITTFLQLPTPSRVPCLQKRLLILGTGPLAKDLCRVLLAKRGSFTKVVGFLDQDLSRVGERLVNPSIIGTFGQLFQVLEQYRVDTVAVCLDDRRAGLPLQTLLDFKAMGFEVLDGHLLYEK